MAKLYFTRTDLARLWSEEEVVRAAVEQVPGGV